VINRIKESIVITYVELLYPFQTKRTLTVSLFSVLAFLTF